MPTVHLTDISIKSLKAPEQGQTTYTDDSLPGFGVRVSQGGVKAFVLVHGRSRQRTTLGRYPTISLSQARAKAKEILAERTLGKHQLPTLSFTEALAIYREQHVEKKLKPRTAAEKMRIIEKRFLPRLRHEKLADITTGTLVGMIDKISMPSAASHAHAEIRSFFRWCQKRSYIARSPLEGTEPPAMGKSRERILTDDELVKILKAARSETSTFHQLVELLILTGQRRNQIASLHASFVDFDEKTITWSASLMKGNREHRIPYGDSAAAILKALPKEGLMLPARGRPETPFNGFSKCKPAFDTLVARNNDDQPLAPWTLHDLRRTLASGWQAMGIRIEVTEKYLAHTSGSLGGIVGVYQRHHYLPEMRAAVTAWEEKLQKLLNP